VVRFLFGNTIILPYPLHPVGILSRTTPNQLLPGAFTPLVKQSEPGDDHSPPSRLWVKKAWSYTSILSYFFISYPGINLRLTYAQLHRFSTAAASSWLNILVLWCFLVR